MPYEKLKAWQLCEELTISVYRVTKSFPAEERFGLVSQARRAAFSAGANIAEGCARRGPVQYSHFLNISHSSLTELCHTLRVAFRLGYLDDESWKAIESQRASAARVTWLLYEAVRNSIPRHRKKRR